MYLTGVDGYQNFLDFHQCLIPQQLDNNDKNATSWISTELSPEKTKPFDFILAPIMSDLRNGRMILKFSNSVSVQ